MRNYSSTWLPRGVPSRAEALGAATVLIALLIAPSVARAETFKVGPGAKYKSLQDVAGKVSPGDVVEVEGGASYGPVLFERHGEPNKPIVIRGIPKGGRRPVIQGGRDTIEAAGDHYVFESLEITGGEYRCFFHRADDITLRDMIIHDCPNHGILGADDGSGSMLLEYSEVYHCGEGDGHHPIYMATDERTHPGAVFRMQFCYVHDGNGGNNVKSRAERNEIYFNWIEGARYHEVELIGPDGPPPGFKREDSEVIGNVIRKTNDAYSVRVGGDGTGETNGRYRFAYNTFLLEAENRPVFRLFDGLESIEMHNNVIYAKGGGPVTVTRSDDAKWSTGREVISGTNNWLPTDSTAIPSGWTGTIFGSDPMFQNLAAFDLRPAENSPLRDAAATVTASPPGFDFPNPSSSLGFQPPQRGVGPRVLKRGSDGKPDIGAYEGGFPFSAEAVPATSFTHPAPGPQPGSTLPSRPGCGGGRCGCEAPGQGGNGAGWWAGVLGLALLSYRRRRG